MTRPGLMLLYAGIDILAWADRPEAQANVQREDFVRWTETYLLPGSPFSCRGIDLYSARCGLLHSYSSGSALTGQGAACEVFYAWGKQRPEHLQALAPMYGGRYVTVHVDDLLAAFRRALERFISSLQSDESHARLVYSRVAKWLAPTDPDLVRDALNVFGLPPTPE